MRESNHESLGGSVCNAKISEMNNNNSNSGRKTFETNENLMSGNLGSVVCLDDVSSRRSSEDYDSKGDVFDFPEYSGDERLTVEFSDELDIVEVFPSLPESVLEEMGLTKEQARKLQTEEELDQKFATLSLAFSIDSNTITDRCERQKRYRNQTEDNLAKEIERLTQRVNKLTKLCVNMETTELLASLLGQIEVVANASALAASSAERYGAVQHEQRLSEAVMLMINHVNTLKQQRDLSRKQLQYTKKMLQTSSSKPEILSKDDKGSHYSHISTKRRASISLATLQEQRNSDKNLLRRTSELTFRTTAIQKLAKPTRMDLGVDLNKIKEGMVVENNYDLSDLQSDENATGCDDSDEQTENNKKEQAVERIQTDLFSNGIQEMIKITYNHWKEDGCLSHLFNICAVLCFCFAVIIMADVLFELQLSKR